MLRRFLRRFVPKVAGGLVLAIFVGVVGEWFIKLADEKGLYDHPSQRVDAAMNAFSSFVTQPWFLIVTALFVGLAVGVWLDALLRRRGSRTDGHAGAMPGDTEPPPAASPPSSQEHAGHRQAEVLARLALKNRLGELLTDLDGVKTLRDAERWQQRVRNVIREALGPGEERAFLIHGPEMDDRRRDFLYRFVTAKQARLAELIKRVDHLPLESAFVGRVAAGDDRQSRADVEPDMTMREALYRLVGVIKPKALAPDLNHVSLESWQAAALALREAAYKGDIRVWGRQQLSRPQDGYADLLVAIEPEYWRRARLNRFACVHPEVASVCRSEVEPGVAWEGDKPPPVYGHLRVNRAQIERLWPEPGTFL